MISPYIRTHKERGYDYWNIFLPSGDCFAVEFYPMRLWGWGIRRIEGAIAFPTFSIRWQ